MRSRLIAIRTGVLGILIWGILALVVLGGGYWLSDRVYDAGIWPLGAVMRLALLGSLLFFAWMMFLTIWGLAGGVLGGDPLENELNRIRRNNP